MLRQILTKERRLAVVHRITQRSLIEHVEEHDAQEPDDVET